MIIQTIILALILHFVFVVLFKSRFEYSIPGAARLPQRIKKTFDPQQRINDGKLIPSDKLRIELLKPIATNTPGGAVITQV